MSNPQQQHAVIAAFAQNQSLLSVTVLISEKNVTQLANYAFAQDLFLHSAVALIPLTSAMNHVATKFEYNYVPTYHMHVMRDKVP